MMKRTSILFVTSRNLVGLHKTVQLLDISGWGIDLEYFNIELFALEMNRDHSVIFEVAPKYYIWTLLLTVRATPFLLRDPCPQ